MNNTEYESWSMTEIGSGLGNAAGSWWQNVLNGFHHTASPTFPPAVLLGIIVAAAVLSVPRITWRVFGLYVTFVHELGHAFAALSAGRKVHGLKISFDHSGQLLSSGRPGAGATWSGFWGYPAPAVVGLTLVWSVWAGWAGAAMSVGALLLLLALLFLRNWAGILVAVLSAAVAQLLVMFASAQVVSWVVLALGIALVVGSVRDWFKVLSVHTRRRNHLTSSDAYILSQSTRIPASLWLTGFALVITVSAAGTAWLLWMLADF